ncbi:MAG: class I SAM-dependent methyltransferase [Acidimicrobiales bacterium]
MLTVDFERLHLREGDRVLDLGCGGGRHAFEVVRRGAGVVACDRSPSEVSDATSTLAAMAASGECGPVVRAGVAADVLALPFGDATFSVVIASEVLEHVPADRAALAELTRVLAPGGVLAATVPRWWPERICWALDSNYHAPAVAGGHVRVYRRGQLVARLSAAGLRPSGSHHAHGLHSPYWWLRCAVGVENSENTAVAGYRRLLEGQIVSPRAWVGRLEELVNPWLGKSLVVYARKPDLRGRGPGPGASLGTGSTGRDSAGFGVAPVPLTPGPPVGLSSIPSGSAQPVSAPFGPVAQP